MYPHLVSLNVVRGGLRLMGYPQPQSIKSIHCAVQPDGCVWHAYEMEFSWEAARRIAPRGAGPVEFFDLHIGRAIQECFLDDILVMSVRYGWSPNPVFVTIVTKFNPKDSD